MHAGGRVSGDLDSVLRLFAETPVPGDFEARVRSLEEQGLQMSVMEAMYWMHAVMNHETGGAVPDPTRIDDQDLLDQRSA